MEIRSRETRYLTIQVCILMWSLWEVVSGECCYPLAHLLLNEQHLHLQETQILYTSFFFSICVFKYKKTFTDSHMCCNLFVSLRAQMTFCQPTSVALPWLRACSVKLQLLWMCSFPWRRDESWACRTCTQVSGR